MRSNLWPEFRRAALKNNLVPSMARSDVDPTGRIIGARRWIISLRQSKEDEGERTGICCGSRRAICFHVGAAQASSSASGR
jgi:hypothetical protein